MGTQKKRAPGLGVAVNPAVEPGFSGLLDSANALKLGLFSINVSGGINLSAVPRNEEFGWDWTSRIARKADSMGLELLIPVARWLGYGGDYDIHGGSFETLTWASAIAAQTTQITVAATVHIAHISPVFAAKAAATIDHVSKGRVAINCVMGWYPQEAELWNQSFENHDNRYQMGAEWMEIVRRLWTDEDPFDYKGKFFTVNHAVSNPKPSRMPVLLNAGTSPSGVDFCAHYCDFNLGMPVDGGAEKNASSVRNRARDEYGRDVKSLNVAFVVCDRDEEKAKKRYQQVIDNGDWEGSGNLMRAVGLHSESFPHSELQKRFIASGGAYPLVGTPEMIADAFITLHKQGVSGIAMGFIDYVEEMEQFEEEVMPLLRAAGLRA